MTQAAERSETARLDELAAVTKEYARFSGPAAGFALALLGCWLLGAQWVHVNAPRPGELLFLFAPLVWVALASSARACYQRYGEVLARWPADPGVRAGRLRAVMLFIVFVVAFRGIGTLLEAPRGQYDSVFVATYVAIAMFAVRLVRTSPWIAYTYWAVAGVVPVIGPVGGRAAEPAWYAWGRIWFALVAIAAGIVQHVRYRRLERRLAALKDRA